MLKSEAAAYLAGVSQTEGAQASAPTNLHVISGEVGEKSEDGSVRIYIDGTMFSEADEQYIEVDTLGGLEEGDIATILLSGESGHAMTPLAIGSVGSIDRIDIRIASIEADYVKATLLEADVANLGFLTAESATITDLQAADVTINGSLEAATGRIDDLEADHVTVNDFTAATGRIGDLEADHVTVADFQAEQANIDTLQANTADIATIRANSAKVQNLTAAQLEADHATVGSLSTTYATIANLNAANGRITNLESTKANISDLEANYITADVIDATYMHANMSNSDVAWIENGTIKNGAIVSAMINDVSANKLTAGTINGSVINVTNLNADNITTGTINGQRIGTGSLSLDKLADDVYTEAEVNNIVDGLNNRIDGAIETFTGTAVPTLNNSPASSWNTTKLKDEHVGDVYYVVNSQSQQNGYCYRFTKSGSTYSWQLIKDSDVTAALSRLTTAEGKITTFDSDISTLKTDTGTLTTRTTNLETRMSDAESDILDKVDTTTFNEVSDTVDAHTQTISQHTTALSNKADNSTVTAVTNRVSTVEQDVDGIETSIGELQTTVSNKADSSTVTTVSNRLNTVSDTVDGHTQTLTSVQNTLSTKADSSTVSTLSTQVNTIEDTVDGHTSQLSSITSTQTTMQSTLDKTVKSSIQLWYSKANTTAPSKPTSKVTSTSTSGNAWRIVVPAYNASYPHYYYCWQYEYVDGTYGWSAVVRDIAMGESQSTARTADSNASAAVTTANTASTNASTALTTANTANTNASEAKTAATTASTTASEAKTTAETAASDASTAKTNAASAVSTANSANTTATNAQNTANANIKSSVQLWFTKANSTAPNKPTSVISTSNANTANAWDLVVPVWNSSYPHYFYCYQQQKGDGTYQWTDVVYDRATSEAQQLANTTSTNLSTLQTDYATFKQTTEQFESTVGTTYATKTELNDATDDITALEGRVSTNETSISNNASAIALKANSSDVYTKSGVDGLISTEVTNRNAAITAKANEITSSVSQTYATKTELADKADGSDLTALASRVTTNETAIEQNAGAIALRATKTEVAETYATKKQLDNRVEEELSFLYRATSDTEGVQDGLARIGALKGNTVVWNQLVQNGNFENISNWGVGNCSISASDNELTMVGGETSETPYIQQTITATANSNHHKLLYAADVYLQESGNVSLWSNQNNVRVENATSSTWVHVAGITSNNQQDTRFRVYVNYGGSNSNKVTKIKNVMVFDLTLMFGAGNEPATVAEFEAMYPLPYYPYSAPTLKPVSITGIKSTGFNLWDEEWEVGTINTSTGATKSGGSYFRSKNATNVLPSTEYYFETSNALYVFWYEADGTYIGYKRTHVDGKMLNTPANCRKCRFVNVLTNTYNHDICVNLSGSRNGEYEPYWCSERAIPVATYFPNGMRSAGSVRDELTEDAAIQRVGEATIDLSASGVEFSCDGVTNNAGLYNHIIAFTDGAWSKSAFSGFATTGSESSEIVPSSSVKSSLGAADEPAAFSRATEEGIAIRSGLKKLYYRSKTQYTEQALSALLATGDNSKVYAPLATPVTTQIDPPLNLVYKIDHGGTEEVMFDTTATAPQSAPILMSVTYGMSLNDYLEDNILRLSETQAELEVQANEISMKVSESDVTGNYLVGKINLDATTATIAASKVNIEGAAIFTGNGRLSQTSLNNAYDANGAAATAKNEAISTAAADATAKANATYEKIRSQGIQLVTNGNGYLGDNTNWPTLTFDGSKSNGSPGSFTRSVGYASTYSSETFPIDPSKQYIFEFDAMSAGGTGILYSFLQTFDVDGHSIDAQNVLYFQNTLTTLASDLNVGDTTVKLTSAANFAATTADHQRSLIFWDYANSFGYTYPTETYSRNYYSGLFADDSKVDKSTGVITLKKGWEGPKKLAGTPVSQSHSGSSHNYLHAYIQIPDTWTHYSAIISGIDTVKDGNDAAGKFRQGSATARVGFLWNYGVSGNDQGQIWVTNISVKEATPDLSDAVKRTQRIYYRCNVASTPAAPPTWVTKNDDGTALWTKMHVSITESYKYIYTCEQYEMADGTLGHTDVLLDNTITVIDGGHITTGTIDTNRLDAATIKSNIVQTTDLSASKITSGTLSTDRLDAATIKSNIVQTTDLSASKITSGDISADRIKANVISAINSLSAGTIDAARINATQLIIGQSQVTNLTSDLAAKADSADIPTNVSDLTNDSGFQTSSQVESAITGKGYQTSSQVESAITSKGYATTTQAQGYANTAKTEAISAAATDATTKANAVQDNLNATRAWYAECPTAAGNAAKVATITPATTDFALAEGVTVAVKFTYANGVASPTLNVNNTGGKSIKRYGTTAPSTSAASSWNAGNVVTLVYDGTYWQMTNWLNNNDNYYDRENYKAALAASTEIAAGCVAAMGSDNKLKILAANSAFDISGPILYVGTAYSAANVTDGATRATNYTFWGTPFALTNTHAITGAAAGKPVYIVGTLSGNMFTPNSDVFTCTTPTSTDNLVYMRLGIMSTTANAVLESQHPLYMYFNGAFQQCDKSTADAAKTATNYISLDTDGIKIADANPSSATTYLQLASTFLDFIRGGVSMIKAWIDNSVAKVRIGAETGFNTLIDDEGIKLREGTATSAQFTEDLIELGGEDAEISLCGGKGLIKYDSSRAMPFQVLGAENVVISTNSQTIKAYVGVSDESVDIYSGDVFLMSDTITVWATSLGTSYEYDTADFVDSIPVTLYDNASASASAAATLSETAANFKRLTIFFKDTDGNYSSTEVWSPNGKRIALSLTWINGASTQEMYQRVRWVTISGTSISTYKASGDSKYRTGQIKLGATASVTNSDYIAITHVIGYR